MCGELVSFINKGVNFSVMDGTELPVANWGSTVAELAVESNLTVRLIDCRRVKVNSFNKPGTRNSNFWSNSHSFASTYSIYQ